MRTTENTEFDKKAKRNDVMLPVITAAAVAVLAGGLFLVNTMMNYNASFNEMNNYTTITDETDSETENEIRTINAASFNEQSSKNELSSEDQKLIDIADCLINEYHKPFSNDIGSSEGSTELISKSCDCFHVKHGRTSVLDSSDICYSDFTIVRDKVTGNWVIDNECTVVTEL